MNAALRPPPAEAAGFRLLVVDDDLAAIRQLGRLLSGYAQVSFATSGADALSMACTQRPDLILLDAEMPMMSGFEVFKALREDPRTAALPVVFATSHTEPEVEAAALRMGAADFICKPFIASQLLARVRTQLRQHSEGAPAAAGPAAGARPRLLIVDDDPAAVRWLSRQLAEVAECHFALDEARALALLATLTPDLVMLDFDLPGDAGPALCRRLKAAAATARVPVVFVTEHRDAASEARAFASGGDDFIGKPCAPGVLQARVRRLVDRKRHADAELAAERAHWQAIGDARVAEVVAAADDAIVSADAMGRLVLANAAACALFGLPPGAAVGRLLAEFVPGPVAAGRRTVRRVDGRTVPVELSLSSLGAGGDALRTLVLRETTVRDRAEAGDSERNERAAARVATAAMLSFILHEAGNPLTAIMCFTQLAEADTQAPLAPAQRQRNQRIAEAARRLEVLLHDVVDLNRLETGQFGVHIEPVDAAPVVRAVCTELAAQAEQAGVVLRHALPAAPQVLAADPRRLHQCLVNLVSNAIKYGRGHGHVELTLSEGEGELGIAVRDDGAGLGPQQLAHLFEPYNRLGRETGPLPGSGLGLLLTRELTQAMGGRLAVDSRLGAGSCFTLWLPRGQAA